MSDHQRHSRLSDAAPKMLAALKMVRDANSENPHFPCNCMTAINAAIADAELTGERK